jgi:predicted transcriptional regulator
MESNTDSDDLSLSPVELDRLTLAQWYESRGIARATAFRLVKLAGIVPHKVRVPCSRAPVSALDPAMACALDALADRLKQGESMAQLEASTTTALAPLSPSEPVSDDQAAPHHPLDPSALLARLEAGERAIRSGLPLTTSEVAWLLGARPGGDRVQRGYVVAVRHGRNCWTLDQTD